MSVQAGERKLWRVLVVDDLDMNRRDAPGFAETLKIAEKIYDCEIRYVTNLRAAVRELGLWRPHLIFLDIHMPRDSWEPTERLRKKYGPALKSLALCEQITSEPFFKNVVVAVVSVDDQEGEAVKAAGAHGYYTKDVFDADAFEELLERVKALNPTPDAGRPVAPPPKD